MKTKTLDSTKIYWLDKEETVKAKLVGLDLPHGFGSTKYTFRVIYGGSGDIVYMDSNLPKTIHEVVEQKPWSFTTPIAMKCTEEQFNEIKDKLVDMGYEHKSSNDNFGYPLITTNYDGIKNKISFSYNNGRAEPILETFNPDLFLALAAMTDKKDGIKGEWWMSGLTGKLIMQSESSFSHPILRKATEKEIIEHFEKKEFVLQLRWYVELTESNRDIVIHWHKSIDKCSCRAYNIGSYYGIFESGAGDAWSSIELASQYQIITNDQFKKYVLKEAPQSCQKTPVIDSIECTVNVEFDAEESSDWIFANIVEWSKNRHESKELSPAEKYLKLSNSISKGYFVFDYKSNPVSAETVFDKTIIPIPPSKQATLFDDRVEITDWKPKDNDEVLVVSINVDGWGFTKTKYKFVAEPYKAHGFIKRTESEAKQLVEKLKQAML